MEEHECAMADRVKDVEDRLHQGDLILQELKSANGKLDEMYRKTYIDNGTPCFQTVVDRLKLTNKFILWLLSVTFVLVLSGVITYIVQ